MGLPARGLLLVVYRLGKHAGRYAHVADTFNDWRFEVCAFDQRGYGESAGVRGVLLTSNALLDNLAEVLDETRQRFQICL